MSHAIPEPYVWDESFRVFYDNLDDEHKAIFKCIFDCIENNDAAHLATLVDVTTKHFAVEEGMMQKANYAAYSAHKPLHTDFLKKINALSAPLDGPSVDFAKKWLVDHIMDNDFKYKGKL